MLSGNQRLLDGSGRFDRRASYSHKEPTSASAIKALPHIEIYRIFMAMAVAVLESQRGKRKFVENGYSYVFNRRSTDEGKCSGVVTRNRTDVLLGYTLTLQPIKKSNECMIMHTTVMQLLSLLLN